MSRVTSLNPHYPGDSIRDQPNPRSLEVTKNNHLKGSRHLYKSPSQNGHELNHQLQKHMFLHPKKKSMEFPASLF